MNFQRIINLIIRQVMRRLVNRGISKGIDMTAGRGKPAAEMTPEERKLAADAKQTAKRVRQARRATRRIGRF
ncbi:MAG: hypothetical protein ACC631_01400 [Halocynthiibacter sp.]